MERDAFLARVRAALATPSRVAVAEVPPPPRPGRPGADVLVARLARELEEVGGVVHRANSPGEARDLVLEILARVDARRLLRGATPLVERVAGEGGLDEALLAASIERTVAGPLVRGEGERARLRAAAFEADVGLTSAEWAVAETGTLALVAGPGQGRAISLLPPLHIALLDVRDLVRDLGALPELHAAGLPSALTFITGPSRTGDIELTLTIGVHGPGALHCIVCDF